MSIIFRLVIASLATYKPSEPPKKKRGRPPKTIYDIDRTPIDEAINDTKLTDGMRGETGFGGKTGRPSTNRKNRGSSNNLGAARRG